MSKEKSIARTLKQAQKLAGYHCKEVEEMALDVGQRIMRDQTEWLDAQMKDILPPRLYEAGKAGESEEEIATYLQLHKVRIIFIADHLALRIMIGERVHSQFITQLNLDGEPVKLENGGPAQN